MSPARVVYLALRSSRVAANWLRAFAADALIEPTVRRLLILDRLASLPVVSLPRELGIGTQLRGLLLGKRQLICG